MALGLKWTQQQNPIVYVSPRGMQSGTSTYPNDGCHFGPDTTLGATAPGVFGGPYSLTYGIQEAIAFVSAGGTVIVTAGEYQLKAPLYNTGSHQTVIFEPGVQINFLSNAGSYNGYVNWNSDYGDIWVGCNYVASGTPPTNNQATYHDCNWMGNGAVIYCSGQQSVGNAGEQVFVILSYINNPALTTNYGVLPSYNIGVDGFVLQGFGGAALVMANNAFTPYTAPGYRWTNVRIVRIIATMASNTNAGPFGSGMVLSGCYFVVVEDCSCDCSNTPGGAPDVSNLFITSQPGGDTQNVVVRRSYFKSGGGSASTHPGSVFELQSCTPNPSYPQFRGNTHDLLLEDCTFDSGTTSGSPPLGGFGGGYIDDTDMVTGLPATIYNLEFRRCRWINCGVSFSWASPDPGVISFDGEAPQALSHVFYPPTWYGPEQSNRSILHRSLSHELAYYDPTIVGSFTQALRLPLTTTNLGIASVRPLLAGQYRITLYLVCKIPDTPTVIVNWTDPETPPTPLTSTLFNAPMFPTQFATATFDVVGEAGTLISVLAKVASTNKSVFASVVIEQIQ